MIYRVFDESGKYRGYKTAHNLNTIRVPWSVNGIKNYAHGIQVVDITAFYRTRTKKINDARIALNNIIERQDILSLLPFNI